MSSNLTRIFLASMMVLCSTFYVGAQAPQENEVSPDLLEIYAATQEISEMEQFDGLVEELKGIAVDQARSKADKVYARNLLSWGLNRRGELRSEHAAKLVASGDLTNAADFDTKAAADFRSALKLDPKRWRARHNLAIALAMAGQYDEAIEQFSEVIKGKPDYSNAYFNRAELYFQSDRFKESIADYTKAIELKKDDPQYYNSRGHAHFMNRGYNEAIADYKRASEIDPETAEWLADLGDAYQFLGRWKESIATYRKAASTNTKLGRVFQNAAWLLATCPDASIRNASSAVASARKAIELDGEEDVRYLDTLAAALAANGQFNEAIDTQERAIELAQEEEKSELQTRLSIYQRRKTYVQPIPEAGRTNLDTVLPASSNQPVGTGARK